MNRHLIAAAAIAVTAFASSAASATTFFGGTLEQWSTAGMVSDGGASFSLLSYLGLDKNIGVTISHTGNEYSVGFSFDEVGIYPNGYTGGNSIAYTMAVNAPQNQAITQANFDTVVSGTGLTVASKVVEFPGATFFSINGSNSGWQPIGSQSMVLVTDTFTPVQSLGDGQYKDAHNMFQVTAVPEPETYAMMLAGLGVLGFMGRKRKTQKATQ